MHHAQRLPARQRPAICHRFRRGAPAAQHHHHFHVPGVDAQRRQPFAGGVFALQPRARRELPNYNAQVLVFFIITVAAAEVAVGLAIIVALYRAKQTIQRGRHQQAAILDPMNAHMLPWIVLFSPLTVSALLILLVTRRQRALERLRFGGGGGRVVPGSCLLLAATGRADIRNLRGSISARGCWSTSARPSTTLSKTMLIVVTGVGLLVHIYSLGYMQEDRDMAALLRGVVAVHVLHARHRAGGQFRDDVHLLGTGGREQLICSSATGTNGPRPPTPRTRRSSSTASATSAS